MNNTELLRSLCRAEAFSNSERHKKNVSEAKRLHKLGKLAECQAILEKLPTDAALLSELVEKLKGKSVYNNIKRISEGKVEDKWELAKGYSSLLTHIFIECQQHRLEYSLLTEYAMQKLFTLI